MSWRNNANQTRARGDSVQSGDFIPQSVNASVSDLTPTPNGRRERPFFTNLEDSYTSSIITDDGIHTHPANSATNSPTSLRFDHNRMADPTQPLNGDNQSHPGYGAVRRTSSSNTGGRRRGLRSVLPMSSSTMRTDPRDLSPLERTLSRPMSIAGFKETIKDGWRHTLRRTPSTYDPPLDDVPEGSKDDTEAVKINGIRVWYSSFTSIDWLHDAIKDSRRTLHLRRRRSIRGRIKNILDRFTGWAIVTIIGLLAALVAFSIVRSEQWLFDLKEGRCTDGFFKAKRFCCPVSIEPIESTDPQVPIPPTNTSPFDLFDIYAFYPKTPNGLSRQGEPSECSAWQPWTELFDPEDWIPGSPLSGVSWMIEYISYIIVAIALALGSSILTLKLSASTSFLGRKDSSSIAANTNSGKTPFVTANFSVPPATMTTRKVLYFAAGSGIPEIKTILSGFVIHGFLGGRVLFTKSVGLAMSVASGLSLGKEGPFVHIVCCIGNIISRFFEKYETNEAKRREILSAASAAGVAVAFGAPVGGVLFSLEEVSYFFPPKVMWRSFFCAMVAAVTLKFLNPFGTGKVVLFQVTYDQDWHATELIFFLLLGVFGGLYGAYFSKLNYKWSKHVRNGRWLGAHPKSEVVIITLITAMLSFLNPYTRLGGTELVYHLFAECRPNDQRELCAKTPDHIPAIVQAIGVALLVKGCLTIVTFGIKVPAGIFIPTLGVGACAGRILGLAVQWMSWVHPDSWIFNTCRGEKGQCVVPGVYAMVGAAATLSGVTRTTVSLAVIMFELTRTLNYVAPVMLSILVAKTVADAIESKGIYDLVIELNQLPYLDSKAEYRWGVLTVADVMERDVDVINADKPNTVTSLRNQLSRVFGMGTLDGGFPIVQRQKVSGGPAPGWRMMGYISHNELEHALDVVQDQPDSVVQFHPLPPTRDYAGSITSSVHDAFEPDLLDFTIYMDQAPLTVHPHSPLEVVQQMFVKLGARYIVVINSDGLYQGVIDKKRWLEFLHDLEAK